MNKLYRVEETVKEFLINNPETRDNDTLLQKLVMIKINPDIANMPFSYVMDNRTNLGLPPFESIRRARAKLQRQYENLKPSKEVEEARRDEQVTYYDYVTDKDL